MGVAISRFVMTTANAAITMSSRMKMTMRKSPAPRLPMYRPDRAPMDCPLFRTDAHRAPKSCMPAKNTVPSVTQRNAGTQPQMSATAGPTMGAAPATEVKWCPQRTNLLVGT